MAEVPYSSSSSLSSYTSVIMVNIKGNLIWFDKVSIVTPPSFHLDIGL